MKRKLLIPILVAVGLSIALLGCSGDEPDKAALAARAQTLAPADAELASIYNRSCKTCHTIAGTGAPLTGDIAGWQPRMDKGLDILLENVISGFGGMPPFGFCMDCDADQFDALIEFMARGE